MLDLTDSIQLRLALIIVVTYKVSVVWNPYKLSITDRKRVIQKSAARAGLYFILLILKGVILAEYIKFLIEVKIIVQYFIDIKMWLPYTSYLESKFLSKILN
jgi:hypothetical protein